MGSRVKQQLGISMSELLKAQALKADISHVNRTSFMADA